MMYDETDMKSKAASRSAHEKGGGPFGPPERWGLE